MSAVKGYLAGAGFVTVMASIPGWFMPAPPHPAPIVVHELAVDVDQWLVTQHRTIQGPEGEVVPMHWAARVFESATGETVGDCSGAGVYAYPVGEAAPRIPLDAWVGHEACTPESLAPGVIYRLSATWWQDDQAPVTAFSEPFRVEHDS